MKTFWQIVCVAAWAIVTSPFGWPSYFYAAGATTYLINENCEGSGTPSGWTDTGTVDWDYTTSPGAGSQSVQCGSGEASDYTLADADTYHACMLVYVADATPASTQSLFGWRTSSAAVCIARLTTTGGLAVNTGGSDSTETVNKLSDATWYYIWLTWVDSGTCTISFALGSSGVKPLAGDSFSSKTGGTTSALDRFRVSSTSGAGIVGDNILVDSAAIGDQPAL